MCSETPSDRRKLDTRSEQGGQRRPCTYQRAGAGAGGLQRLVQGDLRMGRMGGAGDRAWAGAGAGVGALSSPLKHPTGGRLCLWPSGQVRCWSKAGRVRPEALKDPQHTTGHSLLEKAGHHAPGAGHTQARCACGSGALSSPSCLRVWLCRQTWARPLAGLLRKPDPVCPPSTGSKNQIAQEWALFQQGGLTPKSPEPLPSATRHPSFSNVFSSAVLILRAEQKWARARKLRFKGKPGDFPGASLTLVRNLHFQKHGIIK